MTETNTTTLPDSTETVAPPPPATLLQMMTGYWVSQALYVAAKLGVADLLVDGPRSVDDLATATQAHALLASPRAAGAGQRRHLHREQPAGLRPHPHGVSAAYRDAQLHGRDGYHVC